MSNDNEHDAVDRSEQDKAKAALKKVGERKPKPRLRKQDEKFLRRVDFWGRAIWVYLIVGFFVTIGGLYVSSNDSPSWFLGAIGFFGIALRIVLLIGVIALIVWLIRMMRRWPESARSAGGSRLRKSFREKPLQSSAFLLAGMFLLVLGPIGILYYFLLPTTFTPSPALRNFSNTILVIAAVVGFVFGLLLIREERVKLFDRKTGIKEQLIVLFMPIFAPLLLAVSWLFFAFGPLAYTMHLLADKETKTIVEANVKGGSAGTADFMCSGFWTVELHDHSFWWPRRLCNIDLKTKNALRADSSITLRGQVSRFGIDVETYKLNQPN
jgi:MFS family permease